MLVGVFDIKIQLASWLAVRCWALELPYSAVIPEGKDDTNLGSTMGSALVQVKSRRDHLGLFPVAVATGRALKIPPLTRI